MNKDLISRSALTDAIVDLLVFEWGYEGIEESVKRIFSEIPAVDAETVCKQMGLVKEAFEMAKADLVAVVRCRDCVHWDVKGLYCHHPAGLSFCGKTGAAKGFCYFGERRSDEC